MGNVKSTNKRSFVIMRNEESKNDIQAVKKEININEETFHAAFERLEKVLDEELPKLSSDIIPEVTLQDLLDNDGKFSPEIAHAIKKHGVVIIRKVFEQDHVEALYKNLSSYLTENELNPFNSSKTLLDIYWSKEQIEARHHPNMVLAQKALLNLWTNSSNLDSLNLDKPLTYNDRLRYRKPGNFRLQPHLDSGSLSRWSDPNYRKIYQHIFDGNWEEHDSFDVSSRGDENMNGSYSFFRAFQGWTSLTESGPGDGTLQILPLLKEPIAHILMRSLLKDIPDSKMVGHTLYKGIYYLDPELQKKLCDAMISLPKVFPGDTVWWHCDLIHSVEEQHDGKETNSVLYIPVGPDCPLNRGYLEKAKENFLAGENPPDFQSSCGSLEKDFRGRATLEDLNEIAKEMMGF